jgi:hypothetical protein
MLDVFLDHKRTLPMENRRLFLVLFLRYVFVSVALSCFVVFFLLQVLFVLCLLPFETTVDSLLQILQAFGDKNTFALTACLGLNNKHDWRISTALFLSHQSLTNFFVSLFEFL